MLTATMRDIAIIIIALQSIIIGVLIGVLIWQIWRLVKIIQTEIKPIVDDTQATINTVRGTTTFVSDSVVQPIVRSRSSLAKWRGTALALAGELGAWRSFTQRTPPAAPPPPAPPPPMTPPTP